MKRTFLSINQNWFANYNIVVLHSLKTITKQWIFGYVCCFGSDILLKNHWPGLSDFGVVCFFLPKQMSATFLIKMLVVFLARTDPASRNAKPACISRIREPMTQRKKSSRFFPWTRNCSSTTERRSSRRLMLLALTEEEDEEDWFLVILADNRSGDDKVDSQVTFD